MTKVYWGYLRGLFRAEKLRTGDEGAAMFQMVRLARIDGCPDHIFEGLVQDLRDQGDLTV